MKSMTPAEILALPALVNVATTSRAFSISQRVIYDQVQRGDFLIEPIRFNTVIRFRRSDILEVLRIQDQPFQLQAAS